MALYAGSIGRRLINYTVNSPRLDRAANRFGKVAYQATLGLYTPGLTRESYHLFQRTAPGERIEVKPDGFYRADVKVAGNRYISERLAENGLPVGFTRAESDTPGLMARYCRVNLRTSPVFTKEKVVRMAKSVAPLALAAAIGGLAYKYFPPFRHLADSIHNWLKECPKWQGINLPEILTSGLFMGALPDLIAQKVVGGKFNWRRFLGMTALMSFVGGVYCRFLYDLMDYTYGPGHKQKKILLDQFIASPVYMFFYLLASNVINKVRPILNEVRAKYFKLLPLNQIFWGLMGLQVLYDERVPPSLKVFVAQFFSLVWFSFSSKEASATGDNKPKTRFGRVLNTKVF